MSSKDLPANLRRLAHLWLPALALLGGLGVRRYRLPPLPALRREFFDAMNRARPRPPAEVPAAIVEIDDESLERLGQWPWPRTLTARLIERLRGLGASAVALDFVFAEPDRTSPRRLGDALPSSPDWSGVRARLASLPDNDELLARALARGRAVVAFLVSPQGGERLPLPKAAMSWERGPGARPGALPGYAGAVANLPALESAAAGDGCATAGDDPDGVIRRLPLLFRLGDAVYPSLAAEALRVAGGLGAIGLHGAVSGVTIGPRTIPTQSDGALRLYFSREVRTLRVPAWKVLAPAFRDERLRGRIALVGITASGLAELHGTPLGATITGVELHAEALSQILSGSFLTRPAWADLAEVLLMLALGGALIALMPRVGPAWGGLGLLFALAALNWLCFCAYSRRRWLIDPAAPALALGGVFLSSALVLYAQSRAERRRLELLDRLKDELVSTVSHDLRGPVAGIIMYLDAILRGTYGPLTEKQRRVIELLLGNGRRLTFFVSNILDAAKIKAGRLQLHMSELRVEELFAETDGLYLTAAHAKKVAYERRIAPGLPPFQGDREKLEQVLNNIVGNALKFTPAGGRITLDSVLEGGRLLLRVADTGYGIAPEKLPALFTKLSDLDGPVSVEKSSGPGLGLSICKAIVDGHGGTIRAESQPGQGTTVSVFLPIRRETPA
ncbi:MAG: CHASE2 domain-containing protein [Elusimicrobia bacterium]|nr:CHASE2 domain-containing protein [Elusimicrobiota bacterium]